MWQDKPFIEKCYSGANAANKPPPRQRGQERQNQVQERANQNDSKETTQAAAQDIKMPRLHSGAAIDRPDVSHLTLPPNPEVVWQQPQETHLIKIHKVFTNKTLEGTHIPKFKQSIDVEAQM